MMDTWNSMGTGGFVLMAIFWVAIATLVAVVAWNLTHRSSAGAEPRRESGLDVLKARYARGEIDREEFTRKIRDLTS
jgi:putative membrane protein